VSLESFHPTVASWFRDRIGEPSATQVQGWPAIAGGGHVLVAAPTGTGKTLTAFLGALDRLLREGPYLADTCRVLYISPLRALANDIAINVERPLAEWCALDPFLPRLRVLVRTGDTDPAARQAMARKPPHVLATTPESLGILLTSASGQRMLGTVDTVIVDEIHAVAGSKRGAHLALSLARLDDLRAHAGAGPVQRIGLSATQKPLDRMAQLLAGTGRPCTVVDIGHLRAVDLDVWTPSSELSAVCSATIWGEYVEQLSAAIQAHRTTLIFVSTRSMAERLSQRLIAHFDDAGEPGETLIACHHGSLSKERRLDAEQRLKAGSLRALIATGTLELGLDIGEIDLAVQIGSPRAIATFLQRVGRAGHSLHRVSKARIIPLTVSELVEACALLRAVRTGELDAIIIPEAPLDVLAQQVVALCVDRDRTLPELHALVASVWSYRQLDRDTLARTIALHTDGRGALLHYDRVTGVIRATKRARLTVTTCSGAIPDTALFQVREDPEDLLVGTLDEDFSIESSPGDIFQLGNTSWQILRVDSRAGVVRVRNAHGAPPTIPFWFGEAPGRTRELSQAVGRVHAEADSARWLIESCGIDAVAAERCWDHLERCRTALSQLPTADTVICERFFDDAGGQHVALHACFGTRINRAWGLALRKRFCTGFGFELEAAATDEGLLLSLAPTTSFALSDVFTYLSPTTLRETLLQACVTGGQFETRWRWAATIALIVERRSAGTRTPPHLLRIRANDRLIAAFPGARTCPDNLPPGPIPVPEEHPIIAQTVHDCLHELMDIDGLGTLIRGLRQGTIRTHAVETPQPSPLAEALVAARPYAFLDDTPLEERRTRAISPSSSVPREPVPPTGLTAAEAAALRQEAWPQASSAEEVHEILSWIGWVSADEIARMPDWVSWLDELRYAGRAECINQQWLAVGSERDAVSLWRGRLDGTALFAAADGDETALLQLEQDGLAARIQVDGEPYWIHRRWLHRHLRAAKERRRAKVEPVSQAAFWRFLARWQGVHPAHRRDGHVGVADSLRQLAALELPAAAWTAQVLPARVGAFLPTWLDEVTLTGEFIWGRLWLQSDSDSAVRHAIRTTPITLIPREDAAAWLRLAGPAVADGCSGPAQEVLAALVAGGALFTADLFARVRQLPATIEDALGELVATGLVTCDSASGLRWLLLPSDRRRGARPPAGRWTLFRAAKSAQNADDADSRSASTPSEADAALVARTLLLRTGVVIRAAFDRERIRCPWRDVLRQLRLLELQGRCLGGRFVAGATGEQFALPAAVQMLRPDDPTPLEIPACDPLNYSGILTPTPRVRPGLDVRLEIA